jgi:hypothetical protein
MKTLGIGGKDEGKMKNEKGSVSGNSPLIPSPDLSMPAPRGESFILYP